MNWLDRDLWLFLYHLELDRLLVEILLIFELGLWHRWPIYLLPGIYCHSRKMLLLLIIKRLGYLLLMHERILVHYDRVNLGYRLSKRLEVLRRVG